MSYSGASVDSPRLSSEFGSRRAGHGKSSGEIVVENIPVVLSHADAVIAVGAAQAAGGSIQFNHADGSAINAPQDFDLYVVSLTSGAISSLATTGGSTGIAIKTGGGFIAATPLSKKWFRCFTGPTGLFNFTWTDNASEVAYLAVRLPSGRLVISAQLPTS
jgi:hypothetical protein